MPREYLRRRGDGREVNLLIPKEKEVNIPGDLGRQTVVHRNVER